jgi:hypothetical protein
MGSPRITYAHYPHDATSESDVRARAWAYVFDCYRKKKAAPESRPDDTKLRLAKGVSHVDQRPG